MSITHITADKLRTMDGQEALILQDCGGDLQEWLDGINEMFTKEAILLDSTKFTDIFALQQDGMTCLLFPMDETVKLNIGKLAIWRIATHENFGGTWLSDFVPNRLGGFARDQPVQEKPDCQLIGQDGNIFNLLGIASRTLKNHGMEAQSREMLARAYQSGSYHEALGIIGEYVNITGPDALEETMEDGMNMA